MMEAFNIVNALDMLSSAQSSQVVYWNVYLSVTLAILAFVGTAYAKKQSMNLFLILIVGYSFFAIANVTEIFLIQIRVNTISTSISNYVAANEQLINSSFRPIFEGMPYMNPYIILIFHLLIDFQWWHSVFCYDGRIHMSTIK